MRIPNRRASVIDSYPWCLLRYRLGAFILPYNSVRAAGEPEALLLKFLSSTYEAAAETGGWGRAALECELGIPVDCVGYESRAARGTDTDVHVCAPLVML
jgi:hypothetical protein